MLQNALSVISIRIKRKQKRQLAFTAAVAAKYGLNVVLFFNVSSKIQNRNRSVLFSRNNQQVREESTCLFFYIFSYLPLLRVLTAVVTMWPSMVT